MNQLLYTQGGWVERNTQLGRDGALQLIAKAYFLLLNFLILSECSLIKHSLENLPITVPTHLLKSWKYYETFGSLVNKNIRWDFLVHSGILVFA